MPTLTMPTRFRLMIASFAMSVACAVHAQSSSATSLSERLFGSTAAQQPNNNPQSQATGSAINTASNSADPLPAEQAFALSAVRQDGELRISFTIANGYYLYKDKISLNPSKPNSISSLVLPKGVIKYDETFAKNVEAYRTSLQIPALKVLTPESDPLTVDVYSRGCADIGICYPPQRQRLSFAASQSSASVETLEYNAKPIIDVARPNVQSAASIKPIAPSEQTTLPVLNNATQQISTTIESNEAGRVDRLFAANNPALLVLAFIGFGLLLAFTPCVLPMVPIVSAIVLGAGSQRNGTGNARPVSTVQGFVLSAAYVLGMCVTYTAIGIAAGLAGAGFSAFLQQPWVLVVFAVLMCSLAGAQFGWYDIKLPSRWIDAISQRHRQLGAGEYLGVALMGALSALMVGPCVTAPLAGTLGYIAQTGNAWTGGLALFSLALGMGLPLLVIGAGGASLLPKAGAWMNQVNYGFGLMLLAVALWMVQSLLPIWLSTMVWLLLCVMTAILFGAFKPILAQTSNTARFFKALSYLLLVWAIAIVWGMAGGRFDALSPLQSSSNIASKRVKFDTIAAESLAARIVQAKGTPVVLDVYADWCVSCIEFERYTFNDPNVALTLQSFTLLKVDVTKNTAADQVLLKQLGVFGPPAIIFYDAAGLEIQNARVIGFQSASVFLQHLKQLLNKNS